MMKIGFDTNILMRYIQNDFQAARIEEYLKSGEFEIHICDVVIAEFIITSIKYYKYDRLTISQFLFALMENENVKINKRWLVECLNIFTLKPNISFVDISAYIYAKIDGYLPLYSFDKKLQKFDSKNILEMK